MTEPISPRLPQQFSSAHIQLIGAHIRVDLGFREFFEMQRALEAWKEICPLKMVPTAISSMGKGCLRIQSHARLVGEKFMPVFQSYPTLGPYLEGQINKLYGPNRR
jgi:hypothetical protein